MKKILYIILLAVCSGVLISVLFAIHYNYNIKKNAFTRNFRHQTVKLVRSIDLKTASFAIIGGTDTKIKLNIYADRLNLYQIDYNLDQLDTIKIKYSEQFNTQVLNIYKDYLWPNRYAVNSYGDIAIYNGTASKYLKIKKLRSDFFQVISPNSIVARTRYEHNSYPDRSFTKFELTDSARVIKQYYPPGTKDGIFANDGMLLYDRNNARILYMYFYKGEIINLDTNLNLLYVSKTIDTVRFTNIKTGIITSRTISGSITKRITQITPPPFVDTYITTSDNFIYVLSKLKADNETQLDFNHNNVIDVYNTKNGKYFYSFYIPKYNGQNLSSFSIKKNCIVTKCGQHLVSYQIQ